MYTDQPRQWGCEVNKDYTYLDTDLPALSLIHEGNMHHLPQPFIKIFLGHKAIPPFYLTSITVYGSLEILLQTIRESSVNNERPGVAITEQYIIQVQWIHILHSSTYRFKIFTPLALHQTPI